MKINIAPTFIIVHDLPDSIQKPHNLKFITLSENRTRIHGSPSALYHLLLDIAKDYDIDLI